MKNCLLLVFVFLSSFSFAQNPDIKRTWHWYFGNFAGLDFSSGSPVPDTNGVISTLERTAVISDTNGVLQCYFGFGYGTNYQWCVYNREHQPMPNGCDIGIPGVSTPRDCAVFIPKPGDDSTYYLFTVDGWENQFQQGLRWHEIDMRQDSGRGDVVSNDNVLFAPVCEQLAATRHANGCDYWVVAHERSNANFLAYKVTSSGIDTVPVVSTVGTDYSVPQQLYSLNGGAHLKFSPNGNIAASIIYWTWVVTGIPEDLELFQFDNATGIFSNCINLPTIQGPAGIGFSSDNTKFYSEDGDTIARMFQWNLVPYDSTLIINSKVEIFTHPNFIAQDYLLGIDGKLYLSNEFLNGVSNPPLLSTIENPNDTGTAVIVLDGSVSTGGRQVSQGLPNFISSFTVNIPPPLCVVGIEEAEQNADLPFYPNPADHTITITSSEKTIAAKIYHISGALLFSATTARLHTLKINVSHFANGLYILQIINSDKIIRSYKLIINH